MLFLYTSIWAVCNRRWQSGSVLFRYAAPILRGSCYAEPGLLLTYHAVRHISLALGVKMSILLFAPALAFLATVTGGVSGAVYCAATVLGVQVSIVVLKVMQQATPSDMCHACAAQLAIGQPFLVHNWQAYTSRAFEMGRIFKYEWTVNWRFVPEDVFLDSRFSILLLAGHAITLIWLAAAWCRRFGGVQLVLHRLYNKPDKPLVPTGQRLSPTCKASRPPSETKMLGWQSDP